MRLLKEPFQVRTLPRLEFQLPWPIGQRTARPCAACELRGCREAPALVWLLTQTPEGGESGHRLRCIWRGGQLRGCGVGAADSVGGLGPREAERPAGAGPGGAVDLAPQAAVRGARQPWHPPVQPTVSPALSGTLGWFLGGQAAEVRAQLVRQGPQSLVSSPACLAENRASGLGLRLSGSPPCRPRGSYSRPISGCSD